MKGLLIIGGMDPSGGAGLLRDEWTFNILKGQQLAGEQPGMGLSMVVSAWTRQGRGRPAESEAINPNIFQRNLEQMDRRGLRAVKVGLMPDALIPIAIPFLRACYEDSLPIILDPVLLASDGGHLGASPEKLAMLCPYVNLLTPNRHEFMSLGGGEEMPSLFQLCKRLRCQSMLIKSYRSGDGKIEDLLIEKAGNTRFFAHTQSSGPDPRGTGCALATSIAFFMARGNALEDAVSKGIQWLELRRRYLKPGLDGRAHLCVESS